MHHVPTLPPVVWDQAVLRHVPGGEVWVGVRTPGTEVPERARVLLDAVTAGGAPVVPARQHDDRVLRQVHDPALLEHLAGVWQQWVAAGFPDDPGQDRVVPYVFPTPGLLGGLPLAEPAATHARAGLYCYDTMTLVGPGTWEAARAAVDTALSAVDLILGGAATAYALCRPPGHHAARSAYGGSCYLNNAAVAAQAMRDGGASRVVVIDVDAHHGNGSQSIFYDRADVLYASLHVDPGAGWFPHFLGHAHETGSGPGEGATRNLPLAPGTGDDDWLAALGDLTGAAARFGADALVVSLGVDAAAADPESPLQVSMDGFARAGAALADLGLPTVLVHEGGYDLDRLGPDTVAVLSAFAS